MPIRTGIDANGGGTLTIGRGITTDSGGTGAYTSGFSTLADSYRFVHGGRRFDAGSESIGAGGAIVVVVATGTGFAGFDTVVVGFRGSHIVIHVIYGLVELAHIDCIGARRAGSDVGDFFILHINAATVNDRAAVVDGQAVRCQIRLGGNSNFLAAIVDGDVIAIFEFHGVIRFNVLARAAIDLDFPAGIGRLIHGLNGVMHGALAGVADVSHGDVAVFIYLGIAAQCCSRSLANVA